MSAQTQQEGELGLLPPFKEEDKDVNRSVYLPESMWEALSGVAEQTKDLDPKGKGYSRNEVIKHALAKFIEDWSKEHGAKKKAR